ncbi:MAG: YraN family protein [Ktedonobacteraceae bacterium]
MGEDIACRYVEGKEMSIVERNYWKPQGEIDIITKDKMGIHFVEVKSVSWDLEGEEGESQKIRPEENMHKRKFDRIHRAIQMYLGERHISHEIPWQIDAIFVFIDEKRKKSAVKYYEHISLE